MLNRFMFLFLGAFTCTLTHAQRIATFEVDISTPVSGLSVPVKVALDDITMLNDSILQLTEVQGSKRTPQAFQVEQGNTRTLHWLVSGHDAKIKKRVYELSTGKAAKNTTVVAARQDKETLTLQSGDKKFISYHYATLYPPAGIDTAYKRSGFIHPLWSPHGQVLTRIQAPDHYHHYGIWNPWTEVLYEGDSVDFWNLARRQGTVRFANFTSITEGPVFGEYNALHEHVVFKKNGHEKTALREIQSVRIYPVSNDYYIADITINMNCADQSPVLLLQYRYGGLGWRTTEQWNNKNSEVLTSEGKNRKDADGTTARWCIVQGEVDKDYAGVVMLSYPANYNHPEPLRIWPENMYDRGDMFANFSPTKNKSWLLKAGQTYTLKYRFIVFNGHFTKEKAESAWQYFSHPAKVTIKKI